LRPASVFRSIITLRLLKLSITNSCDSTGRCAPIADEQLTEDFVNLGYERLTGPQY